MSVINDLAFSDQRSLEEEALRNPAPDHTDPGFWDGSASSLFSGIGQGVTQLALQSAQYGNDPTQAILLDVPTDEDELSRREDIGRQRIEWTERLRPDAQTSGTAAQILFGLGDAGSRFLFGSAAGGLPVAAATVGASMGEQRYAELSAQGVDTGTAVTAGAIEGGVIAAGAFLPAARLFSAPAVDLAATAGANVGLGVAARGGVGAILERNGYSQQAQQYQALDSTAMAIDGLLGGAFWGLGRAMTRSASPETIDAALAGNNGLHAQHGTAPGSPIDARSSAAHQGALDTALLQLGRGEPVDVAGMLENATFLRTDELTPSREVIRQQAAQEVFSTARAELEPIAASGLADASSLRADLEQMRQNLASRDDRIWRMAADLQADGMTNRNARRQATREVDESLTGTQARIAEIESALAANRPAERAAAELDAMNRGEVPPRLESQVADRAEQMAGIFRRSALASAISPDHGQALNRIVGDEISRLLREGGQPIDDFPAVRTQAGEPSPVIRPDDQTLSDLSATPVRVSDPELAPATQEATQSSQVRPVEQGLAQSAAPLSGIDPALPGLIDSILAGDRDIQLPTGALDEEGRSVTMSARDLLNEADAEIARANNDSQGFLAAATCALRFGD